jgi:hypothetical protein
MKTNDQLILDLLKSRAIVQRRLRDAIEDLESVSNELEEAIASMEGRQAVRKYVDVKIRDVIPWSGGE